MLGWLSKKKLPKRGSTRTVTAGTAIPSVVRGAPRRIA